MKRRTKSMVRTPFSRVSIPRDVDVLVVKCQPKPKRIKHGKVKATAAESAWMDLVSSLGCIVCLLFHKIKTPCAVHHIIEGGRRLGHMFTIGLCDPGHHQNTLDSRIKTSRHPNKAQFEKKYGTEYELLDETKKLLGMEN